MSQYLRMNDNVNACVMQFFTDRMELEQFMPFREEVGSTSSCGHTCLKHHKIQHICLKHGKYST